MNNYLLTLVLKPEQDEKARKEFLDSIKIKLVGSSDKTDSAKASVTKEDMWGIRDLSYPIKHYTKGYFAHFEFTTDPKVAKTLDKILKVEEDIIRYLMVRV